MKREVAVAVLASLGLLGTATQAQVVASHAPSPNAPAPAPNSPMALAAKPVARVNGAVLTEMDLLREVYLIFPYAKEHKEGIPKGMEADIRRGALKMIEFEELVYQEAQRRGMSVAPERLAKAEKAFRQQFDTDQQYKEFVQVEGNGSNQMIRTKIKRSLLIEDLLKAEVTDKSAVTLAEAKAFYLKNPDRFKLAESYALQTITIMPPVRPTPKQPTPPPPTAEQWQQMKARADEALRQAKATKNFEEFGILAEKISEDDYRVLMGNHKHVEAKELPPEILQVASKMQEGQISDIIKAENALTIVRLNAHALPRKQTFEEVRSALRSQLHNQKTETLRRALDAKLRKNAKVEEL